MTDDITQTTASQPHEHPLSPGITTVIQPGPRDPLDGTPRRILMPTHMPEGITSVTDWQYAMDNMSITDDPDSASFVDRRGRYVKIPPRKIEGKESVPFMPTNYAQAAWAAATGDMLLGTKVTVPGMEPIYVRDLNITGDGTVPRTWHQIPSIEDEWPPESRNKTISAATRTFRAILRQSPHRMQHGIKFADCAYIRDTAIGKVIRLDPTAPRFAEPFEVEYDVPFSTDLAAKAVDWLRWMTVDDSSAENLARMFACPLLEGSKEKSWSIYGRGGNGKGILTAGMRADPVTASLVATVRMRVLLGGVPGVTSFDSGQELAKVKGKLWAIDADADTVEPQQLETYKKLSTGDEVSYRLISENSVSFTSAATMVIMTNNAVIMPDQESSRRREVCVRMRDGHKKEEFKPLLEFMGLGIPGRTPSMAPFFMASVLIWQLHGDDPHTDVEIGDSDTCTELDYWIIEQIHDHGYARQQDYEGPKGAGFDRSWRNARDKMGLKSAMVRAPGSKNPVRALKVSNQQRWAPFIRGYELDLQQAMKAAAAPIDPKCVARDKLILPSSLGWRCAYVPAGPDKVAKNWHKTVEDPTVDTTRPPQDGPFGIVPAPGYAIVDIDTSKREGVPDGWQLLTEAWGQYGTKDWPQTYLVHTPSGGYHAYYRVPQSLHGRLKNIAHPSTEQYPRQTTGGVPVDIRCDAKGYVIGPTSECTAGDYVLVDMPDTDMPIPEMSPLMVRWLEANEYVEQPPEQTPASVQQYRPQAAPYQGRGPKPFDAWQLDMSPIPEGSRNTTLSAWVYGLLLNHPESARDIRGALDQRGRVSGLGQAELDTIWRSACTKLNIRP